MKAAEVSSITKSFKDTTVVQDVSFDLVKGEILGMVGPNGAGKTTTIRMLMNIIRPDSGRITVLGEPLEDKTKDLIGYLPEERGLYRKISVLESLTYLGTLKGMKASKAGQEAVRLLDRVGMAPHKDKKIEELSRGMGQIIQIVATILHDPELLVLDEPFSGLDPVNVQMLKDLVLELKAQGKAIILSTHDMNQVEEICDRVIMIHKGRVVLYGNLAEVKGYHRGNSILLECDVLPDEVKAMVDVKDRGRYVELLLKNNVSTQDVLESLVKQGSRVDRFEVATPSLNEIFIQQVKGG